MKATENKVKIVKKGTDERSNELRTKGPHSLNIEKQSNLSVY